MVHGLIGTIMDGRNQKELIKMEKKMDCGISGDLLPSISKKELIKMDYKLGIGLLATKMVLF